jgi:hypothetical protein
MMEVTLECQKQATGTNPSCFDLQTHVGWASKRVKRVLLLKDGILFPMTDR